MELTGEQIAFLVILVLAFALLLTERLRNDVVAVLIVTSLAITRIMTPHEALAGFGSEPAIVVAGIFVLGAGLQHTGVSETIGSWVGRLAGKGYARAVAVIMPAVALLSAFTHHLTTTAVMLPIVLDLARERNISPSRLLMPLSFAASLGTTITIIGAPAFLIASSVLQNSGGPGLGIFSIAPIGIALTVVGTVYVLTIGRLLLPERTGAEDTSAHFRLDDYFTEITILPESRFDGKTVDEVEEDKAIPLKVVGWMRDRKHLKVGTEQPIQASDVLLVRITPDALIAIRKDPGVELHPITEYGLGQREEIADAEIDEVLTQAVIAPGSDLIGRTIGSTDFQERYGVIVVGLWRREGWLQTALAKTKLRAGDVLVLQGDTQSLARITSDKAFLMLVPFHGESKLRRKAPLASVIMLATIAVAAFSLVSIDIAALAGSVAMILTGCLTAGQAYRSIDGRIFVFIAGAIPLGAAMQKTGTADLLAGWLHGAVQGWSQTAILLVIFAIVGILTQFMSDAGTTALFAPVAVALAIALGVRPEPYAVTVAMAAVASFLTPIGHHGNLLIYGPGGYRFRDFVVSGAPLTVLVGIVVVLVSQWIWR